VASATVCYSSATANKHGGFALDTLRECLEKEPNNSAAVARPVALPVIINGRFDRPGDVDVFRFDGRAGQEIVAEVVARRLDSPVDSILRLTDASRNQIAFNDDFDDRSSNLNTHHADSFFQATLPATGVYYLFMRDAQQNGGADFTYRLRISEPRPDFELRVVPSAINGRPGATVPVTVYALRKEGFSNEIALALRGAPEGFRLSGARVPAGLDHISLTLTLPTTARRGPSASLCLEGRATIRGREVAHAVVAAEDVMQAFKFHHLVPAQDFKVAVLERGQSAGSVRFPGNGSVPVPVGGTAHIGFDISAASLPEKFQLELNDPAAGINIQSSSVSAGRVEIVLQSDAAVVIAGQQGNLIVSAFEPGLPVAFEIIAKSP
jgi:hypothetical protein